MACGIGEFEQMVLLAVAHLPDEAYAIPIVDQRRSSARIAANAFDMMTKTAGKKSREN